MHPKGVHWSLRIRNVTLAWLNVVGGTCTIATLALMMQATGRRYGGWPAPQWMLANAAVLMLALRVEKTIPRTRVAMGLPLGAAFCVLVSVVAAFHTGGYEPSIDWDADDFIQYITCGFFTWFVFGAPAWIARKRAALGLVGEEKGEGLIAGIHLGYALLAAGLLGEQMRLSSPQVAWFWVLSSQWHRPLALGVAGLAIACSAAALALSIVRNRGRSAFLARIERGEHQAFRID